jgi:hypothetical protein
LDAVNIQAKRITRAMCSFLAPTVPVNIIRTLIMNCICPIKDDDHVLCTACPDQARLLLIPLPSCFGEITDPDSDSSDAEQEQAYLGECVGLVYGLNVDVDECILQTDSTGFAIM